MKRREPFHLHIMITTARPGFLGNPQSNTTVFTQVVFTTKEAVQLIRAAMKVVKK